MKRAKAAGYFVRLLYVKVKLETAIARQGLRNRQVPEEILRLYLQRIDR
jgi:predicted kinase